MLKRLSALRSPHLGSQEEETSAARAANNRAGGALAFHFVIAGHSRPKDGVASLAYDPAIHHLSEKMDARLKAGHDEEGEWAV